MPENSKFEQGDKVEFYLRYTTGTYRFAGEVYSGKIIRDNLGAEQITITKPNGFVGVVYTRDIGLISRKQAHKIT